MKKIQKSEKIQNINWDNLSLLREYFNYNMIDFYIFIDFPINFNVIKKF